MNQIGLRKAFEGERALRQRVQPLVMLGSQLVAGPDGGTGGHGIEIFQLDEAGRSLVVISPDENFPQTASALDDFVGAGAVANYVAEVGN